MTINQRLKSGRGWKYSSLANFAVLLLLAATFQPMPGLAEERNFLDETITVQPQDMLVTNDVNVRSKPSTKGEKVGRFDKGERIRAVGRVNKEWVAIQQDGKDLGFVYAPVLIPLIDGALDEPLRGMTMGPDRSPCEYIIRYEGREEIVGRQPMSIANYEIGWRCRLKNQREKVTIIGYMFITESPYDGRKLPKYQISVDLPGYADEPDQIFSTSMIYDADQGKIVYDGLSLPKLGKRPDEAEKTAPEVTRALTRAMELAPQTWSDTFWRRLLQGP